MKIEVFSIGLGKPLFSWMHRGVKWQICPLLFGGYVRIAGMDKEGDKEPYEISDGFYAKGPWAHLIDGTIEQNYIFNVMQHAANGQ